MKKYLKEIERELGQKLGAAYENTERETRKIFSGETDVAKTEKEYDVIVPRTRGYRESNAGLMSVINVIIGLVVGVAVSFFLLIPAKEKAMNSEHNKEVLQLHSPDGLCHLRNQQPWFLSYLVHTSVPLWHIFLSPPRTGLHKKHIWRQKADNSPHFS